jgi:hypothetical protein
MKKIVYIFTIISFVLTSCDKSELNTFELSQKADSKTINENIETLASLISQASENIEFRQLVKNEVGKQFDGDYDALLLTFIGKEISGEKFEEILANKSNGKFTSDQIVKMIKTSGYLQISIPVMFDEFVPETSIPLTVAIPVDINEKTVEKFTAYDEKGLKSIVSAKTVPVEPVFVVMESERVDDDGNLKVDGQGFIIVNKANRVHYSEVYSELNSSLNNAQKVKGNKEKVINIVSDEEFSKIKTPEIIENPLQIFNKQKSISLSTDDEPITLILTPKDVLQMQLIWQPFNGSDNYKVYRTGPVNNSGVKTYVPNLLIASFSDNTQTLTDIVDYANEEYTYYIIYNNGSTVLKQSNLAAAHSSHRKNNGQEYINRMTISASTVVKLEGWWSSELEIRCSWKYVNSQGVVIDSIGNVAVPTMPTKGSGAWSRYIDWTYGSGTAGTNMPKGSVLPASNGNLFTWDRQNRGFGVYTLVIEEEDKSDQEDIKLNLMFEWVKYGVKLIDNKPGWGEIVDRVQKTISILDQADYIGAINIKWWDPNGKDFNPMTGFYIYISHNPNNN